MNLLRFQRVLPNQHQAKTQKPICGIWMLKADFPQQISLDFDDSSL
ncbi:positive regulator AgmR [Vibrio cholerae]|nr:positive regulator AgmR [Vibrio cholerae]EGR4284493.1 positive regulator AgmR [Vibrio cholerae]